MDKKESFLRFLAEKRIYPYISEKGNVYLVCKEGCNISEEKKKEIIRTLNIKDRQECRNVREELKKLSSHINPHIAVKNWVEYERPREILVKSGSKDMPLSKLFAIILRTGNIGESAEELARKVLNKFKTLRKLDGASIDEICKIPGIGVAKATQIKAALEIGKRLMQENAQFMRKIKSPREVSQYVYDYFGPYLRDSKNEFFMIVLLDIKNKPIRHIEISKGSVNASIVDPKDVIREATLNSASSIILVHNHPSGETEPSEEDVKVTEQLKRACELVNVKVLDHVIIGKNHDDYFSFASAGLL